MTTQYLRNCSLVVAAPSGEGLELGSLRVVFTVRRGDIQTPNSADIRVYNLSDSTAKTVTSEFTQLALKVGYGDGPPQLIFRGSVKQIRRGREDQKNSYLDITAADGDEAYNFAPCAFTLAAGSAVPDGVAALIQQMARAITPQGQQITQGYTPTFSANRSVRGRVYYGMCRNELRALAAHTDCKWSIQDGAVTLIPNTSFIPADPVLITPSTGLIGVPEQTQNGLAMQVLMNPNIKIGQRVKLDSSDVNQFRYGLDRLSTGPNLQLAASVAKLNADGLYYVMRAEHSGDTRGQTWYTTLTCLAVDATVPLSFAAQAAIAEPFPSPRDAVPRY